MGHEGHDHPHGHHHHHHAGHHDHAHHDHAHHDHGPSPVSDHKAHAPAQVSAYVVTCSDSRDGATDRSGAVIRSLLEHEGHSLVGSQLVRDDPAAIEAALKTAQSAGARAV